MNILLYSRSFPPDLGGVEAVSLALAQQITAAGHACVVVTETAAADPAVDGGAFRVERAPGQWRRLALVRAADLVHSNGASLALFFHARLLRKPFVWTHAGYQMVSVDGLGWLDGEPAPLTPAASLRHFGRRRGLRAAAVQALKLGVRRVAGRAVDRNIAITRWVAERQPLPRQVVIYNPFTLSTFVRPGGAPAAPARFDLVFVGRLVGEKGVATLLRALALVNERRAGRAAATLLIVGDGPERESLERLAASLGVAASVSFAGRKQGSELVDAIAQARIAVVPSDWEEAMGGVALELLAAGLPLIVSERGGMAECVGEAAWTFPNRDHRALADRIVALLDDEALRASRADAARQVLARFDPRSLARQYLDLYQDVLAERAHRLD